ncbi:MAG TPA: hypothetical protein VGE43_19420 [Acidimicrobiales bacterium]
MKLNVGCGPHYADGWTNTDLIMVPGTIEPDVVVWPDRPFPFEPGEVERAYLGHVLEHVPWDDTPEFLADLRRVLAEDGRVCIVGPDTLEAIRLHAAGREPWGKVAAVIEGTGAYHPDEGRWAPMRWDADRHHWNCHEARVAELLADQGWTVEVIPRLADGRLDAVAIRGRGWPLVDDSPSQFSVEARP